VTGCGDAGGGASTGGTTGANSSGASSPGATDTSGEPTSGATTGATSHATTGATTDTGAPTGASAGTSGSGEESGTTGASGADACADSVLTWENFGEPFMLSWCTGCHHSALPSAERACAPCYVNFDNHAGVHPLAGYIELRVLDWVEQEGVKPMPPAAIIADDERALLREYLECGAPGPEPGQTGPACPDPGTMVPGCM